MGAEENKDTYGKRMGKSISCLSEEASQTENTVGLQKARGKHYYHVHNREDKRNPSWRQEIGCLKEAQKAADPPHTKRFFPVACATLRHELIGILDLFVPFFTYL